MKKLLLPILFFSFILSSKILSQTASPPTVGNGTSDTPYEITSLENLYWIAADDGTVPSPARTQRWAAHYKQTANINASGTSSWIGGGWVPIGDVTTNFSGSYNGQEYSISDLYINRTPSGSQTALGLFGFTGNAVISNVKILDAASTGNASEGGQYIGALVGFSAGDTIIQCSSTGTLTGAYNYTAFGGLIGYAQGTTISKCYSSCSVSSTNSSGGGAVLGGLVGTMSLAATVSECYSNGSVSVPSGTSHQVGGLVGLEKGDIYGGNYCAITNCYSTSSVTGTYSAGGFVSVVQTNASVIKCYSSGLVSGDSSYIKGFINSNSGTVTDCFWDEQTSGCSTGGGGTACSTSVMKAQSTFLNAGWSSAIWYMDAGTNSGYPYLAWQNVGGTSLPVELVSFTATAKQNSVELAWKTATEQNNYGFEVEKKRMKDELGIMKWEKIGFVEGNGNSNSPRSYSFIDASANGTVAYRLKQIDRDGKHSYSQKVEVSVSAPMVFALEQNYPNPFNPTTTIGFTLAQNRLTTLKIYDIVGREVTTLVNEVLEGGAYYQKTFDAGQLASGMYFVRLQSGQQTQIKKMLLMK